MPMRAFAAIAATVLVLVSFNGMSSGASASDARTVPSESGTTYGPGHAITNLPDGSVRFQYLSTFQRWDGAWRPTTTLNRSEGEWPFLVEEGPTDFRVTRLGQGFRQVKVPLATYEVLLDGVEETFPILLVPPDPVVSVVFESNYSIDVDGLAIRLRDSSGAVAWTAGPFHAWDSADPPRTWDRPITAVSVTNGLLNLTLNATMLTEAAYPIFVDPTWTLSASAGWGASTFQDTVEDKGDHNIKIGWLADNFNDNTNEQWRLEAGAVTFSGGTMNLGASSTVRAGVAWSNQKIEFHILLGVDLTGTATALFRYQDAGNYYQLRISESAKRVYLEKRISGSLTTLGSFAVTVFGNDLAKIVASGNHFEVSWNGIGKLWLDDPAPPGTPLAGPVKFSTGSGTPAYIDDIRVWNTPSGTVTAPIRDAGTTNRPLTTRIAWTGIAFRWADSMILSSANNATWSDPHYIKSGPKSSVDYGVPEGDQTRYYTIKVELRSTDDGTPALSEITTTEGAPSTPNPTVALGYEPWQYYVGGLANIVDGNLFASGRDIGLPAKGFPLELRRSYNSKQAYSGPLGLGWTHNFNVSLSGATDVALDDGDGSRHLYTSLGSNLFSSPSGLSASKLVKNADSTFSLFRSDGTRWDFTSAGRLALITDRNGNKLTFTYDGSNRLSKVQDDAGIYLELLYDANGRIQTARDHTLRAWTFFYADRVRRFESRHRIVVRPVQPDDVLDHVAVQGVHDLRLRERADADRDRCEQCRIDRHPRRTRLAQECHGAFGRRRIGECGRPVGRRTQHGPDQGRQGLSVDVHVRLPGGCPDPEGSHGQREHVHMGQPRHGRTLRVPPDEGDELPRVLDDVRLRREGEPPHDHECVECERRDDVRHVRIPEDLERLPGLPDELHVRRPWLDHRREEPPGVQHEVRLRQSRPTDEHDDAPGLQEPVRVRFPRSRDEGHRPARQLHPLRVQRPGGCRQGD